jgi:hypothetical protein
MKKDETYHTSAITYNKEIAVLAESLVERIPNAVVQTWCQAVARQHRFHEKRHRAALEKLLKKTAEAEKEQQDG